MLPQNSVFCYCVFWPEGMLQGNPSGSDIHLFSLEIWAFTIFSLMFIQLCGEVLQSIVSLQSVTAFERESKHKT